MGGHANGGSKLLIFISKTCTSEGAVSSFTEKIRFVGDDAASKQQW